MSSRLTHDTPSQPYRGLALLLRGRSGLTQRDLAALLGVSERAIQKWEAGLSYPSAEHLKALIALYLQRGVFTPARETEEVRALWEALRQATAYRVAPFDEAWFATLSVPPVLPTSLPGPPRQDWGEAPEARALVGREAEAATITQWLLRDNCRLVAVVGLGGIGKTAVVARIAQDVAPEFAGVCWRSLRNAPPVEEWLAAAIHVFAPSPAALPAGVSARLAMLCDLLRAQRALLVLDNLETILQPQAPATRYREGYEGYGEVLRRVSETRHQSCLLVTSRELPPELAMLAGAQAPVRVLRLGGLDLLAARALLQERSLNGDEAAWQALVNRCGGNPLMLRMLGRSIAELFGDQIDAYLTYVTHVHGPGVPSMQRLLDDQLERLTTLEQAILYWLSVEREPVTVATLMGNLPPGVRQREVLEALDALWRRSFLERGHGAALTLQPVVLEYATGRLVTIVAREISTDQPAQLVSHALVQATAKDYVRHSQERLIAQPLLEEVGRICGGAPATEQRLLGLLANWQGVPWAKQGYGPGNVVNLLRLLRGQLRGLDLSTLSIRQAYLQEVEAQDVSLAGAHLAQTVLASAFSYPTSIALSSNGLSLLAGTSTGEVCLWRIADRTLLLSLQGHTGLVYGVALNGDGTLGATCSVDGTVKLWALESGRLQATLHGHAGPVYGVALSDDGQLVASGSQDGTVKLWEAGSGRLLATLQGHTDGVYGMALSGDGRLVASGSFDGTVKLWETRSGRLLATLQGHTGGIIGIALSRDGQLVASGSLDGTVKLWEAGSGRLLATLQGHSGGVWSVALSTDNTLVASGSLDGTVKLWEAGSGRLQATLQGHAGGIQSVALDGDGDLFASGSQDGTVKLWEAASGRLQATLQGHAGGIQSVALSGNGGVVAGGSLDGTVRLWEAESGRLLASLLGHTGGVWGVALSGNGQLAASGSFDGTVKLWETGSGRLRTTLLGHSGLVYSVALSVDGGLVASSSEDRTVKLWDARSGRLLATLLGHTNGARGVALSGDGRLVVSGSEDGTVRLWEAGSGRLLATLQEHGSGVRGVALSADGQAVASGSEDGTVKVWEAGSGRLLATLQEHGSGVRAVALSGDGGLVASGYYDGTIRLLETGSGRLLATLQGHAGGVRGVALSTDGVLLASGGVDGTIRLWEARSGACLHTLRGDRRYERMDITGLSGVTEAQHSALLALGALERTTGAADQVE